MCSIGRDGEAADALDASPKPRFFLRAGTAVATAAALVPRTPAFEIAGRTGETSALGPIVLVRVRQPGYIEVAGPPSATAVRRVAATLGAGGRLVLIDGAVDRLAALRGADDAIVVAVGAASAPTPERAADAAAGLVARLRLRPADPGRECVEVAGALTASAAAAFAAASERRQVVVQDATHVAFGGRAFLELNRRLDLRCRHVLRPVACTVAPRSLERSFDPQDFASLIAQRTGLPVYDVYAGTVTEASAA